MAKHVLDFFPTFDFEIIGICCHFKEYRLSWALNKSLGLALEKCKVGVPEPFRGKTIHFCLYKSEDLDNQKVVHLLQNKQGACTFVPGLKHIDYFLLVFEHRQSENLIRELRKIPEILTAVLLDPEQDKDLEKLIYE
ncbi:MAG: hypothetical protein ACJAY8_000837 [Sphingobacteriales bacterium]|jgi:hypothetical protein